MNANQTYSRHKLIVSLVDRWTNREAHTSVDATTMLAVAVATTTTMAEMNADDTSV